MYKLLIVDDEFIEIEALSYIISNSSLPIETVQTASSGREAIEKATVFSPDFVLMDIRMPGITGIEAATAIKKMFPDCKIVFLSAYNYFDYAKEAIRLGASDFIIKPVSNELLINTIEQLIKQADAESAAKNLQLSFQDKYKQISYFFESEFINYLLFADCQKEHINEYFNALNVQPNNMHVLILALDPSILNEKSALKETLIKKRLIEYLKKSLAPHFFQILGSYNNNYIYFLLNTDTILSADLLQNLLSNISNHINDNFQINSRIIISPPTKDIMTVKDYFIKYKYHLLTHNDSNVICFPKIDSHCTSNFSWEKEQKLLESILLMNDSASIMYLNEYIDWLYSQPFTDQMLKYYVYGFLTYLIKSIQNNEAETNNTLDLLNIDFMESLQKLSSKTAYQSFLQEQILLLINLRKQGSSPLGHSIVNDICEYIDKNHSENITLPDLSKLVFLNSQYISKRFKEEKGITFSQYLTKVRINHAKNLLKETDLSINEISEQVGYNDPNYFTRAFKRSECITPKSYRTMLK